MAEIKIECTQCQAHYIVDESHLNSGIECLKCKSTSFRRLEETEASPAAAPQPPPPPPPAAAPVPPPPPPPPHPPVHAAAPAFQPQARTAPKPGPAPQFPHKPPAAPPHPAPSAPAPAAQKASVQPQAQPPRPAAAPPQPQPKPARREADTAAIKEINKLYDSVAAELRKVIVGQENVVEELLVAILSGGHCLLEGVPGLAKTLLISSLARAMKLSFKRIQFTPDLMPSDITGTEVIQEDPITRDRKFKFMPGPIFANIILADEINRTPPKTQAAMLEAMQEKQVSIGGQVHRLDEPFFILATQNPLDQEGTYPLPEAQQDRFLFKIFVGYPREADENEIVRRVSEKVFGEIQSVCDGPQLLAMQKTITEIPVADAIIQYANRLVRATRISEPGAPDFVKNWLAWGAGPRATINLVCSAKCFCALAGNPTPSCDDIARAALPVMRHRIALNYTGKAEGVTTDAVVKKLLETVPKY